MQQGINFFKRQGPVDHAAGERTISAWKTKLTQIDNKEYITVTEGSDGNAQLLGQSFEVLARHFGGQKILFNANNPVALPTNDNSSNNNTI